MVHAPRVLGFPKRFQICVQAEIPTAALASGSQDAPEFCHRNLWLSDGPVDEPTDGSRGGLEGPEDKHERYKVTGGF